MAKSLGWQREYNLCLHDVHTLEDKPDRQQRDYIYCSEKETQPGVRGPEEAKTLGSREPRKSQSNY